jgi:hypothetical protein
MHVACVPNFIPLRITVFQKSPISWNMLTDQRRVRGVLSCFDTVDDNSGMKHPMNLKIDSAIGLDAYWMCSKFHFTTNLSFTEKSNIMEHVDGPTKISWGFEWFLHSGR